MSVTCYLEKQDIPVVSEKLNAKHVRVVHQHVTGGHVHNWGRGEVAEEKIEAR